MKTFTRKTTAVIMSVLIVFGFLAFGSSAVVASAESVNHYEYSYNYLKNKLISKGYYLDDTYYFSTLSDMEEGDVLRFYYSVTYYQLKDYITLSLLCKNVYTDIVFMYFSIAIPNTEPSTYEVSGQYISSNVNGYASVNPKTYTRDTVIDFDIVDRSTYNTVSDSKSNQRFNEALFMVITSCNEIIYNNTNITLGNFKFTNFYPENTSIYPTESTNYTVTFNANGHGTAPQSQTVASGAHVTNPGDLTAEGYRFRGWYKDRDTNEKWDFSKDTVQSNITLYAGWVKVNTPASGITINVKSSATVDYRANVTLNATATGITDNSYMLAIYEGASLKRTGNNMQVSYNIGEMTSGRTFTVKAIDSNGDSLKDSSGAEISKTVEIKVKNSFFDILIAFFKGLFGMLPNVEI